MLEEIESIFSNNYSLLSREQVEWLIDRIRELEEGSCRFNCRTRKEAFIAGYELAHGWELTEREREVIGGRCYKEWYESQ